MIELPVWAFIFLIIIFSAMYLVMYFKLSSDNTEKESDESISKDLELERRKARELRDELEMWRHRYRCLLGEKADVYEAVLEKEAELNDLKTKYKDLEERYDMIKGLYETSYNSKGCQGCCMRPVHSVDKEEK